MRYKTLRKKTQRKKAHIDKRHKRGGRGYAGRTTRNRRGYYLI